MMNASLLSSDRDDCWGVGSQGGRGLDFGYHYAGTVNDDRSHGMQTWRANANRNFRSRTQGQTAQLQRRLAVMGLGGWNYHTYSSLRQQGRNGAAHPPRASFRRGVEINRRRDGVE